MKTCPPETITICLAGDYDEARRVCRKWVQSNSRCVTVQQADYIYTDGEEAGVVVTLRSYPRFPPQPGELLGLARELAALLMRELCQRTALICGPENHEWLAKETEKEPAR